ncbi:MAG: quinolinate synthase NadA [Candidatus Aminicenantes bacterium]|nr:quinolinate synthase NadA [Candidatus Aminicenantes bacterium]
MKHVPRLLSSSKEHQEIMNPLELKEKILELKTSRKAIIVAHNYQLPEIQDIADFIGDSLELSRKAAQVEAEVIVFCGVHFMAETAAILAPEKIVLLPDLQAGCPMANMITPEELKEWKKQLPGRPVVCYINTTAAVKAEADICCTSSNAVEVVNSLEAEEILFVPDKNLGSYVQRYTSKKIISWDGFCYVHHHFSVGEVNEARRRWPEAQIWVHPESPPEVVEAADLVLSTGKMVKEARLTDKKEIVIGTEEGILYRLKKENPEKNFYPLKSGSLCFNMKKITLIKVYQALQSMEPKIVVPTIIRERALRSIEKMISI